MVFTATYYARTWRGGNRTVIAVREIQAARRAVAEEVAAVWLEYERRHNRGYLVTVAIKRTVSPKP
jgi:hypothetical protein